MFIDKNGNLYQGDMRIGDREAIEAEVTVHEAKQSLTRQLQEAQFLLDSTQFKFGEDYDLKETPEWLDLKARRQAAREFIRTNEAGAL